MSYYSDNLLSTERATLGESGLATSGLAQNGCATLADDDGLGVREDGGDGEAAGALDIHEERARGRDKSLGPKVSLELALPAVEYGVP